MSENLFVRASSENISDIQVFYKKDKKRFDAYYNKKIQFKSNKDDFEKIRVLGAGSFGKVVLVLHKKTKNYYAAKLLDKQEIVKQDQVAHSLAEKNVLQALNHPFCVYLESYFADNSFLYFVLPLVVGGEMFALIRRMKCLDEQLSRFYAAQVFSGLEYLHYLDLIYRDLKPENILIDEGGYLKITDFGFCKLVKGRTWTLCGTPEYLAPEIILSKGYGNSVDWWSYGVLLYEMNAGYSPFYHKEHMKMYSKIVSGIYKVPEHFSQNLINLIKCLLQTDLTKRYGNLLNGANDIKEHKWFRAVNFTSLINKKIDAPYKPEINMAKLTKQAEGIEDKFAVSTKDNFAKVFENF